MRRLGLFAIVSLCGGLMIAADWTTDGGDIFRSGWQKDEKILTKENVKGLKLLWKIKTDNQVRALHALMAPLVLDSVPTSQGPKELAYIVGVSDNLYAIDVKAGKLLWQKRFTYNAPVGRGGGGGGGRNGGNTDPSHLGFLKKCRPDRTKGSASRGSNCLTKTFFTQRRICSQCWFSTG